MPVSWGSPHALSGAEGTVRLELTKIHPYPKHEFSLFYFTESFQYLQRFLYGKMEQRLWCAKKELNFYLENCQFEIVKVPVYFTS